MDDTKTGPESKVAIIFGATGQDGSYLAELLLEHQYQVVGVKRRSSVDNLDRLHNVLEHKNYHLIEGDVTDPWSVLDIVGRYSDDNLEIYNLAAQSHVGTSFEQPVNTWNVTAVGCLNILEAIRRHAPEARFYQAGSSEMFGDQFDVRYKAGIPLTEILANLPPNSDIVWGPVIDIKEEYKEFYQDENTRMNPRSPYAVAKLAAHQMVKLYRDSYNLFACNGVLFNHETMGERMPIIFTDDIESGTIDIKPIGEVAQLYTGVKFNCGQLQYQSGQPTRDIYVWDNKGWTKVKYVSGYPHQQVDNKYPRYINARNGCYFATGSHIAIMDDLSEKKTSDIVIGDRINVVTLPVSNLYDQEITIQEAELLGLLIGDGYTKRRTPRFINKDSQLRDHVSLLWHQITGGAVHYYPSRSGFTGEEVGYINLTGDRNWLTKFQTYTIYGDKCVPKQVLNGSKEIKIAFLNGYNTADGLKANPCIYNFKNFKTNSSTLAAGLIYLIKNTTNQDYNITIEQKIEEDGEKRHYYSVNLLSDRPSSLEKELKVKQLLSIGASQRSISYDTNISRGFIRKVQNGEPIATKHHLKKDKQEVKKIIDLPEYEGWFFDLETESGTFSCGVGQCHVHNSPRRGDQFVTKKIINWLQGALESAEYELGVSAPIFSSYPKLQLGNLDASRDWGHAKDYVEAMWLMLQQDKPDDFVIATGKTHTVREFLTEAFKLAGIDNWEPYVEIDESLKRPAEVPYLCGEASKAKRAFGWEPTHSFSDLVADMFYNS